MSRSSRVPWLETELVVRIVDRRRIEHPQRRAGTTERTRRRMRVAALIQRPAARSASMRQCSPAIRFNTTVRAVAGSQSSAPEKCTTA